MSRRIALLQKNIETFELKLAELRSGVRKVDPEEKAKIDKLYEIYSKEWKGRRRMVLYYGVII